MTVFDTIVSLIKVNGKATLSQIISFSGLPRKHVLKVLEDNRNLFQTKPGTGQILRAYRRLTGEARNAAMATGQFYTETDINYGCAVSLEFPKGVNPEADALRRGYACGGLGDSYTVQVVLKEREGELRAIGMKPIAEADLSQFPGYVEWVEDVEDRAAVAAADEIMKMPNRDAQKIIEIIKRHMK